MPAELDRLVGNEREVAGAHLHRIGPAEALRTRRQPPTEHDQSLPGADLGSDPVDQRAGVPQRVMGVVDHDRARLAAERDDHRVDHSDDVVGCRPHDRGRVGEPGGGDCGAQAARQERSRHAARLEEHLDRHRSPGAHELPGEHRLPVARRRLHDHQPFVQAPVGQAPSRHVVGRQALRRQDVGADSRPDLRHLPILPFQKPTKVSGASPRRVVGDAELAFSAGRRDPDRAAPTSPAR